MSRAALISFSLGLALFFGLLASQGLGSVAETLAVAGWGLVALAGFHLLPLALDAAALKVLARTVCPWSAALLARWAGESVNSLLPAGQIGGPLVMARQFTQQGSTASDAAAIVTVGTTLQMFGQIIFALFGLATYVASAAPGAPAHTGQAPLLAALVVGAVMFAAFYGLQRRGLFGRLARLVSRFGGRRDWAALQKRADAIDVSVQVAYQHPRRIVASFALSLLGWLVGVGEVWLALRFLGHPVGWVDALILESLGQAIRGAAFAIPGSLGVQEGGYLLLARLIGLPAEAALALSLAKRAREILLGLPGLIYLHYSERGWRRRLAQGPIID
jgi:putative membrane protein